MFLHRTNLSLLTNHHKMKIKVGNRFSSIRDERKLTQQEMAELLEMSVSAYARIEKNVVSPTIEDLLRYSEKLEIPIQDLLPETISIHSNSQNSHGGGVILGTSINNYYYGTDKIIEIKDKENQKLQKELTELKAVVESLRK